ncbi:hypothetical protein STL3553_c11090 [Salmonella enterica subsp. enterica serovar Typhimurium str. L-3553]|uniref:Uncharacterized protein n=4 Tax=Salmonella enterica I TaxID=59201 RepID=A0A0F6AZA1_SALT1|nr:hypothetical protein STM14_1081 [Salmonella enterica subsp. enterica serovar Typhimurium str. 14028S]BAP06800.1 hypothetical protein STL3553_c11090 [Salmonella enterica subsp. enterica serovar Typhimurium str. L-3553]
MVRRPLPRGSYRHHEWRLSTPCVDFTSPVNMVFTCMIMQHIHNTVFSSSNVFAKQQVIVKAKHRFLVQHASYSLERAVNCHFVTL